MSWSDVPPGGYQPPDDGTGNSAPSWATGPTQQRPTPPSADPAASAPPWAQTGGGWGTSDPGAPGAAGPSAPPWAGAAPQPGGWAASTAPTSTATGSEGAVTQLGPPTTWLWIGAVVPVVAAALFLLAGPVENAVGWALAAFGSVAALAVFQTKDLARRASSWYAANDSAIGPLRVLVLVLALGVAAGHAYFFADWISRLDVFA